MNRNSPGNRLALGIALVVLGFLMIAGKAQAVISNPNMVLLNDVNGDGVAAIGDSITFSCRSTNASAGDTPFVDLSLLGNSHFYLPPLVGNYYTAVYSCGTERGVDTVDFRPNFYDNDGAYACANALNIDLQPPRTTYGIQVSSTPTGTAGEYKDGDTFSFAITFDDADACAIPSRLQVYADLTNLGFGSAYPLTDEGPGTTNRRYSFSQRMLTGREKNGDTFYVTAVDDAGNKKTYARAISYDTRYPEFQSVSATVTNGSPGIIKAGNRVKITAVISNYDSDTLTASHSILIPDSPVTMTRTSTSGNTATFEYEFLVATGSTLDDDYVRFYVTATDDVGNQSFRWSNALAFDTIPPGFSSANVTIIERAGVLNDNIAIIGDTLRFTGSLSSAFLDTTVTIDLSGIGGEANQLMTYDPTVSSAFSLDFNVFTYTSEDTMPRSFKVTAYDHANNIVYRLTMPVIYVDNQPPSISGAQLSKVNVGASVLKVGDTAAVQANITNLDNGMVWTDLSRLGGAASTSLSLYSGSTYRVEQAVAVTTWPTMPIDTSKSFMVYVSDNAGNIAHAETNTYVIDNEPPEIIAVTYTVNPALSTYHPWIKRDDIITFQVALASSTGSIHDQEKVYINLSPIGGTSNQEMTYDGLGSYTFSYQVQSGTANIDTTVSIVAKDNAENTDSAGLSLHIDNNSPAAGPMTVNFLNDMAKSGAVNIGDRLEFIVPLNDPDFGTCTIDLSHVGGPSTVFMNYDVSLSRYYLVWDCASATIENSSYVFRAGVTDKAGNYMSSISKTFEVDCLEPELFYASCTFRNLSGNATTANVGDQVTITASVNRVRLDGGVPTVNLTAIGGNAAQILYDDGAHEDGGPNDGLYGFTQNVASGSYDGQNVSFIVTLTDNAGNQVMKTTEAIFVDNQPIVINSFIASQTYDNNGNTVVDLDGYYTTYPIIATDVVRFNVSLSGKAGDLSAITVDLTPLGINNSEYPLTNISSILNGWTCVATFAPLVGSTNRESIRFQMKVTDVNGNISYASSTPALLVDNCPPSLIVYPIAFVTDGGRLNEANEKDVIRITVRVTNHDGILPQLDLANLYYDNGMAPPSPILFTNGGPNDYTYDWTVPAGLGTTASLTILAYDQSGNMVVGYTNAIRFLSKIPTIRGYPWSRCELASDAYPAGAPNQIANPPQWGELGDQVSISCVLGSVYNASNTPPATVLANIRTIVGDSGDDYSSDYADGDFNTYWYPLQYLPFPVSGAGNYVYISTFTVGVSKFDVALATFPVKVVHPDVNSIIMATTTINCAPGREFGIDTLIPDIYKFGITITETNGDNLRNTQTDTCANIGDVITVWARIRNFDDPGSASVRISTGTHLLVESDLPRYLNTDVYQTSFTVSTYTEIPWNIMLQGRKKDILDLDIRASDDASNIDIRNPTILTSAVSTFTVDNTPNNIIGAKFALNPNNPFPWVGNVGSGIASDASQATVTTDLPVPAIGYIDYSPILGSTSWPIYFKTPGLPYGISNSLTLATPGIDLATYVFPVSIYDTAGNLTATYIEFPFDTTRPTLVRSAYDGQYLTLYFSEPLNLTPPPTSNHFDQTKIRLGWKADRMMDPYHASYTVELTTADEFLTQGENTDTVVIKLSLQSRAVIADWGDVGIWLTLTGNNTYNGEGATITRDLSGNWVIPVPRVPQSGHYVDIPASYAIRPNLVRGDYNAVSDPTRIYLDFDRDMASSTLTNWSIQSLAVVRDRSMDSLSCDYIKRYTMIYATDTVDYDASSIRRMAITLSQPAQDWIATKFGKTGVAVSFSIATGPVLIRDMEGNRVNTIPFSMSVPASLTPVTDNYNIDDTPTLDVNSQILTITTSQRRTRLFNDEYRRDAPFPSGKTRANFDLSRVYLYKNADRTGQYIPLSKSTVPANLNDYASTTIRIQLADADIASILSWNSQGLHIGISEGAFHDLWNNNNNVYPLSGTNAVPINVTFPTWYSGPKVVAVAVSDPPPTKGYTHGQLFYEVDFQTATTSKNIVIPINKEAIPVLQVYAQSSLSNPVDIGSFVQWLDYEVGGKKRTVARFANTVDSFAIDLQREPAVILIKDAFDVFGKELEDNDPQDLFVEWPVHTASYVYNIANRVTSGSGFSQNSPDQFIIDTHPPKAIAVSPVGVKSITAVSTPEFVVTFDERMSNLEGHRPSLRLGTAFETAMTFTFYGWDNASQARFYNNSPFNDSTPQGTFTYYVSGGYDEAYNKGNDNQAMTGYELNIMSKGPVINSYSVITYQQTTSKLGIANGTVTGKPFSPYVNTPPNPNVATISITLEKAHALGLFLHFYQGNNSIASYPLTVTTLPSVVANFQWDGIINGSPLGNTGPSTFELRVYDAYGNEGSRRGTLIYDGKAPTVLTWKLSHAPTWNNKTYFSPVIQSYVKVDIYGASSGDTLLLRIVNPGVSTDCYSLAAISGGYSVSFEGKNTENPQGMLPEGEYHLHMVDQAGNIAYVPAGSTGTNSAIIVIDTQAPDVADIQTLREGVSVSRFNPRVSPLTINVTLGDPLGVASGSILARIKIGAKVVRELPLAWTDPVFTASWDGKDSTGAYVSDGAYDISVIDRAENESTVTKSIDVVTSAFKMVSASQVDARTVRLTFTHNVLDTMTDPGMYVFSPDTPIGIGPSKVVISEKTVTLTMNANLADAVEYTVTCDSGLKTVDGDTIATGFNFCSFTADGKGPSISSVNFTGITNQQEFNVVFDETVASTSATTRSNWSLVTGGTTIEIDYLTLQSDNKTVRVKTLNHQISDTVNYVVTANGVEDLFKNKGNSNKTFTGIDVTPPVMTISVFSNPANEYDITVTVTSNEDISGVPTAVITQSGGTATSISLNAGPTNKLFMGGAHLDKSYPGVVTIQVTGKDAAGNSATVTSTFSTAYVNASVRVQVKSPDNRFNVVFEPGTLKSDSQVSVVPVKLTKANDISSSRVAIRPSVLSNLSAEMLKKLNFRADYGVGVDELGTLGNGYTLVVPSTRISGKVLVTMSLPLEAGSPETQKGLGLYRISDDGTWTFQGNTILDGRISCYSPEPGVFALLRDVQAPRANLLTEVKVDQPFITGQPVFEWSLTEKGSGLDPASVKVLLNGEEKNCVVGESLEKVTFQPEIPLIGGDYSLSLKALDRAGNQTVTPEIMFQVKPRLVIHEIMHYPNPARNRVTLRIATNRADISPEMIEINIYDISGKKVAGNDSFTLVGGTDGTRRTADMVWDLRNSSGNMVANGVYIAKVTLHDPDDWNNKTRVNHKIAVLR